MRYQSKYAAASDCAISMLAPSPVFCGADERGEDADRAERGPGGDADVRLVGDAAEAVVVDDRLQRARPRVVGDAVAREVAVRAGGAVAGDRAHHDRGVELAQARVAEAALLEEPGPHAPR